MDNKMSSKKKKGTFIVYLRLWDQSCRCALSIELNWEKWGICRSGTCRSFAQRQKNQFLLPFLGWAWLFTLSRVCADNVVSDNVINKLVVCVSLLGARVRAIIRGLREIEAPEEGGYRREHPGVLDRPESNHRQSVAVLRRGSRCPLFFPHSRYKPPFNSLALWQCAIA